LIVQSYISYKFPIKQDLYRHRFLQHQGDRLIAYALLLKSDKKFDHYDPAQINEIIEETAKKYEIDPLLIKAITLYESSYLSNAISTTGAMGLMALMPQTVRELGIRDPFDPIENIDGGVRLVKMLSESFQGDTSLILAGFNSGAGNVRKHNGVPPFSETIAYVNYVGKIYELLKLDSRNSNGGRVLRRRDPENPDGFI
jgi:soluble lytic murein transglycosylase-like protein